MNKGEERELAMQRAKSKIALLRTIIDSGEGILVGRYYKMVWRMTPDGRLVRLTRDGSVIEAR